MERDKETGNKEKYMQGLGIKNDSVAKVTEEEMFENLQNDVTAFEKAVKNAERDLENFLPQLDLDKRMWDMLEKPGMLRKIKPDFRFEEEEEYWEINEKKQAYRIRQDRAMADGQLKQLEQTIVNAKEGLEKAKTKLARFKGE